MTNCDFFTEYLRYRIFLMTEFRKSCEANYRDLQNGDIQIEWFFGNMSRQSSFYLDCFRTYINYCIQEGLFTTDAGVSEFYKFDMDLNKYCKSYHLVGLGG